MKTIDSNKIFNQLNALSSLYCYAQSMNNNNCVTPRTKIIIVGTITPPDGNGYFTLRNAIEFTDILTPLTTQT